MTFRSEGELVFAVNAARDLTNLAIACLEFYRRYALGLLGIWIPVEPFTVVFLPLDNANSLKVRLVYTKTSNHQEPVYYDVDDDNYSESWGASNLSHYVTVITKTTEEQVFSIPFKLLLSSKENLELSIKRFAESERKQLQEKERESKIAAHQEAIRKLTEEINDRAERMETYSGNSDRRNDGCRFGA
jgi:predicted RNA-binding protein with RPS1 domain